MDHRHNPFAVKLGNRLKIGRIGNNLTRIAAGDKLGVNEKTVMRWEKAQTDIGIHKLRQMAREYGIPFLKLVED